MTARWPSDPKRYQDENKSYYPENGDEVLGELSDESFTHEAIKDAKTDGIHISIKNRDRNCSIWLPLLLVIGAAMVGITELLAAKWPAGGCSAISRDDIEQRNNDAEGHGDFKAWAWAHLASLFTHIAGLVAVIVYFAWIKKAWYDRARGCAKKNIPHEQMTQQELRAAKAESKKYAMRTQIYCWIFFVLHLLFGLYAVLIMIRSFVELGDTGKRDFIGDKSKYEAVMYYYLLWGFGSLVAAIGHILASILFNMNARFVYQACGGGFKSAVRRMFRRGSKGSAPMRGNARAPSSSYYDSAKRF